MKTLFSIFLLNILINFIAINANSLPFCILECKCLQTTTNCSDLNLEKVPTIAAETTHFDLSFNRIVILNSSPLRHLSLLTHLYLNDNQIEVLTHLLFAGLGRLKHLYLNNNRIKSIEKNSFKNLHSLENLYLNHNSIENLSNEVFSDLPLLQKIFLQNNRLTQISPQIFNYNKVLRELRIENNLLKCEDCEILWLKTFSSKISYLSANCDSSQSLTKKLIEEIPENDFKCKSEVRVVSKVIETLSSPQKPNNSSEKSKKLSEDFIIKSVRSHLVLNCSNYGLKFWTKDENQLQETNFLKIYRNGSLVIKNLLHSHSGEYKCIDSSNRMIKRYSVRILEPPVFIQTPDSMVEVEFGEDLNLKCLATGFPEPDIAWIRRGKQFRINGMILSLRNIKTSDEDIYECVANNSLGIAFKEIKIKVKGGFIEAQEFENNEILESINEAREIVNQAIDSTLKYLKDPNRRSSAGKLMQIARFPDSPESIEFVKSIEIYEKSLEILKRKAESKTNLPFIEFKFEELLTPNQLNILAHLSGCLVGHNSQNTFVSKDCKNDCNNRIYRTYEGFCNNMDNKFWGASLTPFIRLLPPQYEDGIHSPIGWFTDKLYSGFPKPNARKVSQYLIRSKKVTEDDINSHMLMQHGQFLDHDIDFSMPSISFNSFDREPIDCSKTCARIHPCFSIEIPVEDIRRNITKRRNRIQNDCIELIRSSASCGSGLTSVAMGTLMAREQINQLTSFIDGSNIYGSTSVLAEHLRDKIPRDFGLMRTIDINGRQYLPKNEARFPNDCQSDPRHSHFGCFLGGDIRANEQLGLLATHTLWLREHNRIAKYLKEINPFWSGERVYQESRKIVGSELQYITYYQWLPHILGKEGMSLLGKYHGYNDKINPSVANVFATAALRFGHTLISPFLLRLNQSYSPTTDFSSHLSLQKAFFAPHRLVKEGGIDPLLRGLLFAPSKSPRSDQILNNELTEHLFELARDVSLDLAAINIQRGRDHALPDYNRWRKYCNLTFAQTFDDLSNEIKSIKIRNKLKRLYGNPNNVDLWVGAVSEDIIEGSKVGPTFRCLLIEQFKRLRDGDRFYFENSGVLTSEQKEEIKKTSLARIICDNSDDINIITSDVFVQPKHQSWIECKNLQKIDLNKWQNNLMPNQNCSEQNSNNFEISEQILNRLQNG